MGNMKSFHDYLVAPIEHKIEPNPREGPTFDPMLGFPKGRKIRELKCSKEDIENYQVPLLYRDYCACQYVDLQKCWLKNSYFQRLLGACEHDKHEWHNCIYQDRILVSKEYERERRLRARRQRRIQMGLEEDPNKIDTENINM